MVFNRFRARRRLALERLENRQLLAVGADYYQLESDGALYADSYFASSADPVQPTLDADGRQQFDFRVDRVADQTVDLNWARDCQLPARILIDPRESYQFSLLGAQNEGEFALEAFAASGQSLGKLSVPYRSLVSSGANFFSVDYFYALIGPGGRAIPAGTAWVELETPPQSPYVRFGFAADVVFSFQSDRSVDQRVSEALHPVEPSKSYRLSARAIQHSSTAENQLHSLGYVQLDADRLVIEPLHTQKYPLAVDARLAQPLQAGDTSILLTTTEGWSNVSHDPRTRALAWYGYRDASGKVYEDFTYTRHVAVDAVDGLWRPGGIQGNRIRLTRPWSGPTLPVGTAMRNAVDGQSLVPALLDRSQLVAASEASLQGQWTDGRPVPGQFAPGTSYIQLAAIINQSSLTSDERVSVRMQLNRSDSVSILAPQGNQRVVTLDVLANDDGATSILSLSGARRGQVELTADRRQVIYRSPAYFLGTDAFTYQSLDRSGQSVTRQVHIRSLGGNLDSNSSLQSEIEDFTRLQLAYSPNTSYTSWISTGVKNQPLKASLAGNDATQPQYYRLDEIGFQSGSLSLQVDGRFEYLPAINETPTFSVLFTASNGAASQLLSSTIRVVDNEFRRDQARLADLGLAFSNGPGCSTCLFYPAGLPLDSNQRPFLSWRVHLLPMLGYRELYERFKQDEPWDSPHNLALLAEMPDIFRSAGDAPTTTSTRYQFLANTTYPSSVPMLLNLADGRGNLTRYHNVTDGIENTLLIIQAGADKAVPWTQPLDLPFNEANPVASLGNTGPYFNAYFWNSGVHALPTDMPAATFQALATPKQNDHVDPGTIFRQSQSRADFPGDDYRFNQSHRDGQMQQLLLAMLDFESAFRRLAPVAAASGFLHSWRVHILPFLGYQTLYNQYRFNEAWDSPHNLTIAAQMPDVFRSLGDAASTTTTRFRVLGGTNMAYGHAGALSNGRRLAELSDSPSNTMLIVEAGIDRAVPWTMPETLPVDLADFWSSLGTLPDAELLFGMADGSVYHAGRHVANDLMIGLATVNQSDKSLIEFYAGSGELYLSNPQRLQHQLRQIGLAVYDFESAFRFFPMNFAGNATTLPTASNSGLSWRVALLPFLGYGSLYNQFHLNEPWDSPHNLALLPLMPPVYSTPWDVTGQFTTRIQRFSGPGTIDPQQKLPFSSVYDGLSNTIFAAVAAPEKAVPWTKPDDIQFNNGDDWSVVGNQSAMNVILADSGVVTFYHHAWFDLISVHDQPQRLASWVLKGDGIPTIFPVQKTVSLIEGSLTAFSFIAGPGYVLELDDPTLVNLASRRDGHLFGFGPQQRVTLEALSDRNGQRQTKLYIKAPSASGGGQLETLGIIDLVINDNDWPPTLDPIADRSVPEDAPATTVTLTGIGSGEQPSQLVGLAARSLNTELIDQVAIDYQLGSSVGQVIFTPRSNQFGTAVIEVTVFDGGADGQLQTLNDNNLLHRTFTVVVAAVNDPPQIDSLPRVTVNEDSGLQTTTITGISAGPDETQPVRLTATTNSLWVSLSSTNLIQNGNTAQLGWRAMGNRFGQAEILIQVEDGGLDSNLDTSSDNGITVSTLTITIAPVNDAPSIGRTDDQVADEEAVVRVPLSAISAGPFEPGAVRLSATADRPEALAGIEFDYQPGAADGWLTIQPTPDFFGSLSIVMKVEDGGDDDNLDTIDDNLSALTTFHIEFRPVNDAPQLDAIDDLLVNVNGGERSVELTGIGAGPNEIQPLVIRAISEPAGLLGQPIVSYTSGSERATLRFTPSSQPGVGRIRVIVEDGGADNDLATLHDNLSSEREFQVTVNAPVQVIDDRYRVPVNTTRRLEVLANDLDADDSQSVVIIVAPPLEQAALRVNPDLSIELVTKETSGVIYFTYEVIDQWGARSQAATVTVGIAQALYQNPFDPLDVNRDGQVTPLDALLVINLLNDPNRPQDEASYFGDLDLDTNGDRRFSPIDALLIINRLNSR